MKPVGSLRSWWVVGCCIWAIAVGGCSTTGDPTSGGLFGWSETKARDRQSDLEQQEVAARAAAEQARVEAGSASEKKRSLTEDARRLEAELDQLLTTNADLESQLRSLLSRRRVSVGELARLRSVLASNERVRRQAEATRHDRAEAAMRPEVAPMSRQNESLHREIQILLER